MRINSEQMIHRCQDIFRTNGIGNDFSGMFVSCSNNSASCDSAAGKQRGRDHNHYGFTTWLAGGGSKGGYTHGSTDEFGYAAVEDPVHVRDMHATILHLLGFDHEKFTYRYAGLDFRLTGVADKVSVVHDLIA